jgi:outer membrane protein OmpU
VQSRDRQAIATRWVQVWQSCTIRDAQSNQSVQAACKPTPKRARQTPYPSGSPVLGRLIGKPREKIMKKILFASTALVATAGVAAAEISFGGSANFGVYYNGSETIVKNEIDFDIKGSGETDGGLKFGASLDLDGSHNDSADGTTSATITDAGVDGILGTADDTVVTTTGATVSGTTVADPEVYIEMGGLKLTVGNIGEANDVGGISDIGFDGLGVDDVVDALRENGNDDIRIDYSFGDIAVAASVDSATNQWAVSASGTFGDISASAAFRDNDGTEDWNVTVGYSAGAFGVTATYAEAGAVDGFGLDASYTQGDLTVTAAYADSGATDAYGIGASYSLGGGAAIAGGIAEVGGNTVADLGMTFSF